MNINEIAYLKNYYGYGCSYTIDEMAEELGYDIKAGEQVLIIGVEIPGDTPENTYYNVKHLRTGNIINGISGVHLEQ